MSKIIYATVPVTALVIETDGTLILEAGVLETWLEGAHREARADADRQHRPLSEKNLKVLMDVSEPTDDDGGCFHATGGGGHRVTLSAVVERPETDAERNARLVEQREARSRAAAARRLALEQAAIAASARAFLEQEKEKIEYRRLRAKLGATCTSHSDDECASRTVDERCPICPWSNAP